jgi:hypothetical protein
MAISKPWIRRWFEERKVYVTKGDVPKDYRLVMERTSVRANGPESYAGGSASSW